MLNWYLDCGKDSDVVVSSRIRIARNLRNYTFPSNYTVSEALEILEKVRDITPSLGYNLKFIDLNNQDDVTKISLIEKHLISPEFAMNNKPGRAILVNEDENICIMINEEDHLRIQVFSAGYNIEALMKLAIELDKRISEDVQYAYDEKYGFLTSCPTNLGTGMRISVMVHLPALSITGNISNVLKAVNNFGMNIRGVYGEGTRQSRPYVSNF